jgi:hypothetical protein
MGSVPNYNRAPQGNGRTVPIPALRAEPAEAEWSVHIVCDGHWIDFQNDLRDGSGTVLSLKTDATRIRIEISLTPDEADRRQTEAGA